MTGTEKGQRREFTQAHTNAAASGNQQKPSETTCSVEAAVQRPPGGDECPKQPVCIPSVRLLCVLEELSTLSAAVVNSSEDSAEEEGQGDGVRPSSDSLQS